MTLALEHKTKISGLALICPATQLIDDIPDIFRFLNISNKWLRLFLAYTLSSLIGILTREKSFKTAFAPEPVCDNFAVKGGGDFALCSKSFIKTSEDLIFAMSSAPSVVGRENELKLPIGVLFGEDDEILDAKLHGEKFSELTGAELKILPKIDNAESVKDKSCRFDLSKARLGTDLFRLNLCSFSAEINES